MKITLCVLPTQQEVVGKALREVGFGKIFFIPGVMLEKERLIDILLVSSARPTPDYSAGSIGGQNWRGQLAGALAKHGVTILSMELQWHR